MDELETIILNYESDTFSASGLGVTARDARAMALLLIKRLCKVVRTGGTLRCDGDVLAGLLDEVRE